MKKLMTYLLIIYFAIIFTACRGERKEDVKEIQTEVLPAQEKISVPSFESAQITDAVNEDPTDKDPVNENTIHTEVIDEIDLSRYFEGINGCIVFYDPRKSEYKVYNRELSEKESSPCSTFKIVSSLMGLENGVIDPADSIMKWNGTEYWKTDWNKDISFEEAFRTSCVWYFREVTNRLGEQTVRDTLEQIEYGNCDISDWEGRLNTNNNNRDLTGFWIESSLRISPMDQAAVISNLFENKNCFSENTISLLKKVMLVEPSAGDIKIYGKTGMGVKDGKCIDAWYVGMFEQKKDAVYFAIRLDDPDNREVSSKKAKEISINIINDYQKAVSWNTN